MHIKGVLAAAAMLFAGIFTAAEAAPVTYKLYGHFDTGSIGATALSDTVFIWTITADTASAMSLGGGDVGLPAITSMIDLIGYGPVSTTGGAVAIFSPAFSLGIFIDPSFTYGIGFSGPGLSGYNGLSDKSMTLAFYSAQTPIATDHGDWIINDKGFPIVAFVASGIPEPITLALFGAGLAGIGALRRRRNAHA